MKQLKICQATECGPELHLLKPCNTVTCLSGKLDGNAADCNSSINCRVIHPELLEWKGTLAVSHVCHYSNSLR
jgi:hypothetical protein